MRRIASLILTALLLTSFLTGTMSMLPLAFALNELSVTFIEIGQNGVISEKYPTLRLTVKDSNGNFVPGVLITVTNPPYCSNDYPYYQWSVNERVSDYVVRANSFPTEAIRDNFQFTFQKANYNPKVVARELAINAVFVAVCDENGNNLHLSGIQIDMNSIPSHTQVASQFLAVYVNSQRYLVTRYSYLSEFPWENGLCYLVLDQNYNLVTDPQIYYDAFYTLLVGPYLSTGFDLNALSRLQQYAQDLIVYGGESYLLAKLRDFFAEVAGQLIGSALLSELKVTEIGQKIVNNINNINRLWEEYMSFLEGIQELTELGMYTVAMDMLHNAGNSFQSLHDTISQYRGTTRFDYSQVNAIYEQWADAATDLRLAIDILSGILPDPGLDHQVFDVALEIVHGITGIDVSILWATPQIPLIFANSIFKFVAIHGEFYDYFTKREIPSAILRERIQSTGRLRILVPVPSEGDFTLSAYHVSSSMTSTTIFAGFTAGFTVDVRLVSGAVPAVFLSLSGQDGTMSVSFVPQSNTPPFTSTLSISTTASTSGRFTLTVSGSGAGVTRTSQVVLEVLNPPNLVGAITVDPLNSGSGTVMYGAYTRYHGRVDPYYNGRTVELVQSVDGGNLFYIIGQYIPTSNNEWYYPSSLTVVPIWLSAWKEVELPCTYLMKAFIEGTGEAVQSNIVSFTMIKATTSTKARIDRDLVMDGEPVSINGTIFSPLGISGSRYFCKGTYYIEWREEGNPVWYSLTSGSLNEEFKIPPDGGPYCILFSVPTQNWVPPRAGTYLVRIRYSGDKNYEASQSDELKVTVVPKTYPVTISLSGLPSSNTSNVYFDNVFCATLNGGTSQSFNISSDKFPIVTINETIEYGLDARYVSSTLSTVITGSKTYDFKFHKEYRFSTEVTENASGRILASCLEWADADSTINATAVASQGFDFDYWILDDNFAGSDQSLLLTMDSTHILKAFFRVQTFSDGFESGNLSAWTGTVLTYGETATVNNATAHHGLYSGKFASNGGGGDEVACVYRTIPSCPELYSRGYFYVAKSGITKDYDRFFFTIFRVGANSVAYAGWRQTGGVIKWILTLRDGTNYVDVFSSSSPVSGRWYCVELHWKKDSTSGLAELWVDGQLVCSSSNRDTAAFGDADLVRMGLAALINSSSTIVYSDCIKLANARIGPEQPRILSFSLSPNPFSPNGDGSKDSTIVKASFSETVQYTLQIKNGSDYLMRAWNGIDASLQITWDGKNSSGTKVPDGTYNVILTGASLIGVPLVLNGTLTVTVDTEQPAVTGFSVTPTSFNPQLGRTTRINYTLSENCYVTIKIYNSTGALKGTLLNGVLQTSGLNSVVWNGKDNSNIAVPSGTYTIRIYVSDTSGNRASPYPVIQTVTVDMQPPAVTGVSVSPSSFKPSIGQTTRINYTLSESCYVTIKIYDSTGALKKTLLEGVLQTSGPKSIVWNGRDNSNNIVPAGTYTIKMYVADRAGNKATPYPITKTVTVL